MLRHSSPSSTTSSSQAPLTCAQLRAAIEAEEQRQGLSPDSLVAETTLEEAAKRLGLSPNELRERALKAPLAPKSQTRVTRSLPLPSLWTQQSRKLFFMGIALALGVTGIDAIYRLRVPQHLQQASQRLAASSINRSSPPRVLPIDQRFKNLLAQTVGPKATLRMVAQNSSNWTPPGKNREELYPLEGVPDGYEVHVQGSNRYSFNSSGMEALGVAFRPVEKIRTLVPPSQRDETELAWRFVRYGNQWYARAWIAESDLSALSQRPYNQVKVSTDPDPSLIEAIVPASSAETRWAFRNGGSSEDMVAEYFTSLPSSFKVDPELVAGSKILGEFRTTLPPLPTNGSFSPELAYFRSARFSVSSNLVPVDQIKEGQPFAVADNMLALLLDNQGGSYASSSSEGLVRQIDQRPAVRGNWNLVRYGTKLYLRGWIAGPVRKEALGGKNLLVSSSPENPQMGYQPIPITLPLSHFQGASPTGNGWSNATFGQVTLDSHTWEAW